MSQADAGWYHAEGDPPGSLRYWDGGQWVGEPQYPPQPAMQAATYDPAPFQTAPAPGQAWAGSGWGGQPTATRQKGGIGARLLAYVIDILLAVVPLILFSIVGGDGSALGGIGALLMVGVFLWNSIYRQGTTGQSVGKSAVNVTLLGKNDHQPIGIGKSLGRAVLGWILNSIFPIDLIWALFDRENQRLVDKILNTNVFKSELEL